MRILVLLVVVLASISAAASADEWVIEAKWNSPADLALIAPHFQHLKVDRKNKTVSLVADDAQLGVLGDLGVDYRIDMATTANMRRFYAEAFGAALSSIPGFSCYRTVEETYATMDQLAAAHPTLAQVIDIGPSWQRTQNLNQGYSMRALRIGNSATDATIPDKPSMVVTSSIHAREYAPAELSTRFAEWLLDNYGSDPEATWLVDHANFHLILHANPDGRKKAETGLSWRKNTNTVAANCGNSSGIDLNRNFPFHWGIVPGNGGSSGSICSNTYRGPTGMSEPETDNLVRYIAGTCSSDGVCSGGVFPDRRDGPMAPPNVGGDGGAAAPDDYAGMYLDIHSYSQLVMWSWGDTSTSSPNGPALQTFGRRLAWFNGYRPEQADTLYPTDGTTVDAFYGLLGTPSYIFELGQQFFEPCSVLESAIIPDNIAALRYAARSLHAPYRLPGGPDVTALIAVPDLLAAGTPVSLSARIDDTRFNRINGSEPEQNVIAAAAYMDGLPWEGALSIAALSASDGAFDSKVENVRGVIATSGLASGKHLLFVQGTDDSGQAGSPNAVFIEVAQANEIATLGGTITARQGGAPLAVSILVSDPLSGESRSTISDAGNGNYLRPMRAGTVDIHVDGPPGYLSEDLSAVALPAGASQTHDFALLSTCVAFADDVESGTNGWTAQAPWVRTTSSSGNTSFVWATPGYGDGLSSSLSRTVDLSATTGNSLRFDDRCDTESGYDFGRVEISVNGGGNWTEIYKCSGRTSWQHNRIALPASTDNLANLRLRFRLSSDPAVTTSGWAIDNIVIESADSQCRASQLDHIFVDGFE